MKRASALSGIGFFAIISIECFQNFTTAPLLYNVYQMRLENKYPYWTLDADEPAPPHVVQNGVVFQVYSSPLNADSRPIFECQISPTDYIMTLSPRCEGYPSVYSTTTQPHRILATDRAPVPIGYIQSNRTSTVSRKLLRMVNDDPEGHLVTTAPRYAAAFGYSVEEALGYVGPVADNAGRGLHVSPSNGATGGVPISRSAPATIPYVDSNYPISYGNGRIRFYPKDPFDQFPIASDGTYLINLSLKVEAFSDSGTLSKPISSMRVDVLIEQDPNEQNVATKIVPCEGGRCDELHLISNLRMLKGQAISVESKMFDSSGSPIGDAIPVFNSSSNVQFTQISD